MKPAVATPRSLFRRVLGRLTRMARDERGSAAVELGIGAIVLLGVAALAFDLYSLIRADTASARIAATMAEYVSRETAPDRDETAALGQFLYEQELGVPAALVYVVSAVHQPPGGVPAVALWDDDTIRLGGADETATLAQECRSYGQDGWQEVLLGSGSDRLALAANDVVIVVEVCAKLLLQGTLSSRTFNGNIYRLHALPARDTRQLPSPLAYTPRAESLQVTLSTHSAFEDSPSRAAGGPGMSPATERIA